MKTTPQSVLKRIAKLREEHTRNFNLQRWQANDTVSRKIREAWAQWHRLVRDARARGVSCLKLASQFGVSHMTILAAAKGQSWKQLTRKG